MYACSVILVVSNSLSSFDHRVLQREEYWSGLSFSSPGDLPDPEIKPTSPAFQADSLPLGYTHTHTFVVVQSLSSIQCFVTPWIQHTRLPCPSPFPGACSNSCPLSQ